MMRIKTLIVLLSVSAACMSQQRYEVDLNGCWQFSNDGKKWQSVVIPHDWAIYGPFDKQNDLQLVAIKENGENQATEKSGRSGALPWIGEGEYRTQFSVPAIAQGGNQYEHFELLFDGAMSEPVVYVNGHEVGSWAYGYNAFRIDITDAVKAGGALNELRVKLKNLEESSRWYPGAGIYRPVKLVMTGKTYIDEWSSFLWTSSCNANQAILSFDTQIAGCEDSSEYAIEVKLIDKARRIAGVAHCDIDGEGHVHTELYVKNPQLWTPENPYLYKAVISLYKGLVQIDELQINTGIHTITVDKENGFQLNGVTRKIQGVCLHHDLGPLGAAVNKAALIRQIRIMKDMGADAIRTAHNMPSKMQMEVCDSMGMMVMAESFDMWKYPKCKNGYARFFDDWSNRDITNLVRNHRNHPSIIMWSIGNEIPEQWSEEGRQISQHLQELCHRLDPSRPVTQGLDKAEEALNSGVAQVMDVPGFNYRVYKYDRNIQQLPQGFLLGTETASTVSSRGVYKFPVEVSNKKTYPDGQCSSYDTEYCSWSNLPEDDFIAQEDKPYTIGQFVWTGFDYLGEPTPYDEYWPSRSSYFGICDLAGLPKDRYYLYRSIWNRKDHTIHLLPHWTWPGRVGKVIPVYCYTDYPSAELFVNGKSQGRIFKQQQATLDRYRLRWNDVKYEPGELKVVVFDESGNKAGEQVVHTAGTPSKLLLEADRTTIQGDGDDLSYITVSMIDENGNLVPDADDELYFEVDGAGYFQAVCNGDATSLESFTVPHMKLFHGKLVLIVRARNDQGEVHVTVKAPQRNLMSSMKIIVK